MKRLFVSLLFVICCYHNGFAKEPLDRHTEGDFVNGRRAITFSDGTRYDGQFKDGEICGQGTITFTDGSRYKGAFSNGEINGRGTMTFSDGSEYVGEFKDGVLSGQGTIIFPDGSAYRGEFKNNEYHGKGVWSTPHGIRYEGEFKNGRFDGQGIYSLPDGSEYIGYFKKDRFQGPGAWTSKDTDTAQDIPDTAHSEAKETDLLPGADLSDKTAVPFSGSVEPLETTLSMETDKVLPNGKNPAEAPLEDGARLMPDQMPDAENNKAVSDSSELVFSVQVGAFLSEKNAEKLADLLKEKGYEAQILLMTDYSKRSWYAVRIGSYTSLDEAQENAADFSGKENMIATVRPVDSL